MGMAASKRGKKRTKPIKQHFPSTPITKQKTEGKKLHACKLQARELVKEISGFAPYELKAIEMLKRDEDKKCKRFLKKRLGRIGVVKRKLDSLTVESRKK